MDNFFDQSKRQYFFYELLGTFFITVCSNVSRPFVYLTIFFVSLWSWEDSAAHFNPAITMASFVHSVGSVKGIVANIKPLVSLILVQILGALLGLFVTYVVSRIQFPAPNTKTTQPGVPTLCPPLGCATQGLSLQIFYTEFISSFVFIFTFLVLRNFKAFGEN